MLNRLFNFDSAVEVSIEGRAIIFQDEEGIQRTAIGIALDAGIMNAVVQ